MEPEEAAENLEWIASMVEEGAGEDLLMGAAALRKLDRLEKWVQANIKTMHYDDGYYVKGQLDAFNGFLYKLKEENDNQRK